MPGCIVCHMLKLGDAWNKALNLPGIRTLTNNDVRLITLGGDPVNQPMVDYYLRSAHFKAATVSALIGAADAFAWRDTSLGVVYMTTIPIGYLSGEVLSRLNEFGAELMLGREDVCIDKKAQRPEITHSRMSVSSTANVACAYCAFQMLWLPASGSYLMSEIYSSEDTLLRTFVSTLPAMTVFGSTLMRYANVVRRKWIIADFPPENDVDPYDDIDPDDNDREPVPSVSPSMV